MYSNVMSVYGARAKKTKSGTLHVHGTLHQQLERREKQTKIKQNKN